MSLTPILKDLHKKVTGLDITKGNVTDILRSMEQNYTAQPDGGFVDPYELVYEVTIGEMVYDDHDKFYSFECQPIIEFNSEDYYLGDAKEKNTTSDQYGITWNGTPGDERVNPNEPAIGIAKTGIVADEDISGQTLKIYKKVSAPNEGNDDFIVHATLTPGNGTFDLSDADAGFSDILAAVNDGKTVKLRANVPGEFPIACELVLGMIMDHGGTNSGAAFCGAVPFGHNSAALAIAVAVQNGDELEFTTKLVSFDDDDLPTKFHFTATSNGSSFSVTPNDEHTTYASVSDAIRAHACVEAIVALGSQTLYMPFYITNEDPGARFALASTMVWTGTKFMGPYLKVNYDGTFEFDIKDT